MLSGSKKKSILEAYFDTATTRKEFLTTHITLFQLHLFSDIFENLYELFRTSLSDNLPSPDSSQSKGDYPTTQTVESNLS